MLIQCRYINTSNLNQMQINPVPFQCQFISIQLIPILCRSMITISKSIKCQRIPNLSPIRSSANTWTICNSMPITLISTNSLSIHYFSVNFGLICQSYVHVWWIHPSRKIHDRSSNMTHLPILDQSNTNPVWQSWYCTKWGIVLNSDWCIVDVTLVDWVGIEIRVFNWWISRGLLLDF